MRKRPTGVTVLVILFFIGGVFALFVGVCGIFRNLEYGALSLVGGVYALVVGNLLRTGRKYRIVIALLIIGLVTNIALVALGRFICFFPGVILFFVLWYLGMRHAREYVRKRVGTRCSWMEGWRRIMAEERRKKAEKMAEKRRIMAEKRRKIAEERRKMADKKEIPAWLRKTAEKKEIPEWRRKMDEKRKMAEKKPASRAGAGILILITLIVVLCAVCVGTME